MKPDTDQEQFNNIFNDEAIAVYSEGYSTPSAGTLYDYNKLTLKIYLLKAEIRDIEESYKWYEAIRYEERTQ